MNNKENRFIDLKKIKPKGIFLYKFPIKTVDEDDVMKEVTPPLFHYKHYVLCVSIQNPHNFPVLVVPLTTRKPSVIESDKTIYKFPSNPIPNDSTKDVWAITSHIYSVHFKDLEPVYQKGTPTIPKISQQQFDEICKKMLFRFNLNCLDK